MNDDNRPITVRDAMRAINFVCTCVVIYLAIRMLIAAPWILALPFIAIRWLCEFLTSSAVSVWHWLVLLVQHWFIVAFIIGIALVPLIITVILRVAWALLSLPYYWFIRRRS